MKENKSRKSIYVAIIGSILVALILILGSIWTGHKAKQGTENAVNSVSLLYLDELAGRREQVVASALQRNISNLKTAVDLMTDDDLASVASLQAYQVRMKKLYTLGKFAFVDTDGLIYTSLGPQNVIETYNIDYLNIFSPQISLKDPEGNDKKVIIAIPLEKISLEGKKLVVCFMEINMETMLTGVSLQSDNNGTTFCNIYTKDGNALTNMLLGGLASEDNLLEALDHAVFNKGFSAEKVKKRF